MDSEIGRVKECVEYTLGSTQIGNSGWSKSTPSEQALGDL
jgi:hypothetical protein